MPPSRRALLRLLSVSALPPLVGCSAGDGSTTGGGGEPTARSPSASPTPPSGGFEVRLVGSETDRRLFDAADVSDVGSVQEGRTGSFVLPVTLTAEATTAVSETVESAGVAESPDEFEVVMRTDDETVGRFGISPGLATNVAEGEWDGRLRLTFAERATAVEVRETLQGGATDTQSGGK